MTLPYLTDDCFYYILQYLKNDYSTLFNCLLVNRFWCKTTIPFLYANPFTNISKKSHLIISTIIFCFNKEEILQLKKQFNNINIDEEHKPLFEYLKYLEDYNHFEIDSTIISYYSGLSISRNKIYNIIPIFHKSILRQSKNIKQLDISLDLFYMYKLCENGKENVVYKESFKNFNIQNFISNLTKLNSLSFYLNGAIDNEIEQEFLRCIANFSLNLRQLIINLNQTSGRLLVKPTYKYNTTINWENLYKIIQGQNKLKIFKIWNCYSLLNNILSSLEFQKHSLVHIEFKNTKFINVNLKSFNNLYNLEYLKFNHCEGIFLNQCEFLSFKLKELSFRSNKWNVSVTSSMIKYLGASLQRLIIIENLSNHLIENISMYCPNLIFLELRICLYTINLSMLAFLKNLRLNITISYNIDTTFFINLANINVSKISIYIGPYVSNSFEMINSNHTIELEFLKIVLNYIERSNNNSLKIFGMMDLNKELNDEELKLLNQIKAKGVRIMEFNSIHCL
ncbi:hypothetical protein RhiirA4_543472 [Rhizophagus irregularis]|uniref:F-box domain-containing protein n=1 Tax=Rhizophagus irregularis TaxID=588596 RepID=A0A2I1GJ70_9GLOM|nr:hypothetical protein RhiirA4_543472 [Rhizophagus irregularis]